MFEKLLRRATQKAPENKPARESKENSVGSEDRYEVQVTIKYNPNRGTHDYSANVVIKDRTTDKTIHEFIEWGWSETNAFEVAESQAVKWIERYEKENQPPTVIKFTL